MINNNESTTTTQISGETSTCTITAYNYAIVAYFEVCETNPHNGDIDYNFNRSKLSIALSEDSTSNYIDSMFARLIHTADRIKDQELCIGNDSDGSIQYHLRFTGGYYIGLYDNFGTLVREVG